MITLLLVMALGVNGWQFYENGQLTQSNKQLVQEVDEQNELVGKYYDKIGDYEAAALITEGEIKSLYADGQAKAIELEQLRNRDTDVDNYLREEIPIGLVRNLQTGDQDGIHPGVVADP